MQGVRPSYAEGEVIQMEANDLDLASSILLEGGGRVAARHGNQSKD